MQTVCSRSPLLVALVHAVSMALASHCVNAAVLRQKSPTAGMAVEVCQCVPAGLSTGLQPAAGRLSTGLPPAGWLSPATAAATGLLSPAARVPSAGTPADEPLLSPLSEPWIRVIDHRSTDFFVGTSVVVPHSGEKGS